MRFKPFLALLIVSSLPVFAEDYLPEIEEIVQNEMLLVSSTMVPSKVADNIQGATSISKSSSMAEIMEAVENCKINQSTTTKVEADDITVYGMSCQNKRSELISSELVVKNIDGKLQIALAPN